MTQWSLSRIQYDIRKITGLLDQSQIPDASDDTTAISSANPPGINDYLNDFYLNDLDEEMRLLNLKTYFIFNTIANVGVYPLPSTLTLTNPSVVFNQAVTPIYVDGYQVAWYQDPDIYYRIWPQLAFVQQAVDTGDGGFSYSFTLSQLPILQGSLVIGVIPPVNGVAANETFSDAETPGQFINPGNLISSLPTGGGNGMINYITGAVTVNFANAIPVGSSINCHYYPYVASRPRDILFYNQKFYMRPVPNDSYQIKMVAYQQPTALLATGSDPSTINNANSYITQFTNNTDLPMFNEWYQVLVYGTALKILAVNGDHEEYAKNFPYFDKAKLLCQRRTLKQLANQRIQTPYADNVGGPQFPIYPVY